MRTSGRRTNAINPQNYMGGFVVSRFEKSTMSSYQGSASVQADAKSIFAFVSDPENFSHYVPGVLRADHGYGDVIHIEGVCPHTQFRGVGGFHVEEENLRMRWDSRANLNYRGWLQVMDRGDYSDVMIHLEFDPGPDQASNQEFEHVLKHHPESIQGTLQETLLRIKNICESALARA